MRPYLNINLFTSNDQFCVCNLDEYFFYPVLWIIDFSSASQKIEDLSSRDWSRNSELRTSGTARGEGSTSGKSDLKYRLKLTMVIYIIFCLVYSHVYRLETLIQRKKTNSRENIYRHWHLRDSRKLTKLISCIKAYQLRSPLPPSHEERFQVAL